MRLFYWAKASLLAGAVALASLGQSLAATAGETIEIKGEVIDTWCYFSGVMGGPDAVTGSAHHTCALWCAAGGIPVGVRTEDGQVYLVLKLEGQDPLEPTDAVMEIQTDVITARGKHYLRDGVNYIVVEKIVANDGIQYLNHEDYGCLLYTSPSPRDV